jgi:hypothetical protein
MAVPGPYAGAGGKVEHAQSIKDKDAEEYKAKSEKPQGCSPEK